MGGACFGVREVGLVSVEPQFNVAHPQARQPPKRDTRVCTRSSSSPTKLHPNPKFLVQINMSLPQSSSCEAEVSIQKAIQDIKSGVEPLICKASSVRALPHSTVAHHLTGRLP